jgi:putative ABC transport system permease protein
MLVDLWKDLRFAFRGMLRQPMYVAVSVLTLALGIGASTAIFSLVNGIVLRPLPVRDPGRLFAVATRRKLDTNRLFTLPDFLDYTAQNRTLEGLAAYAAWSANLTGSGEPRRLQGMKVSANTFDVLGVRATIGRALQAADDTPGSEKVAVLTDAFWRQQFGADPRVVGRSLVLNGESWTVVGVLPANFISPVANAEIVAPLAPSTDPRRNARTSVNFLRGIARLRDGLSRPQAEADLTQIQVRLGKLYPDGDAAKLGLILTPFTDSIVGDFRKGLWTLFGAVGLLLLIACVNLANLTLVRATARRHEFAVRTAMGASGARLVRQLVTESLLLAAVGGVFGVFLAVWGVPLLLRLGPPGLPRAAEVSVDPTALAFATLLALATGVIFGLAPAWTATRVDLNGLLNEDGRGTSAGPRRDRARRLLVVGETALSVLLLAGAALLVRSFVRLESVSPGFDTRNVLSTRISLPKSRYPDRASLLRFHDALSLRLAGAPGVTAAGSVSVLPLSNTMSACDFTVDGRDAPPDLSMNTNYRIADAGYFKAMGIPLVTGRLFDDRDRDGAPAVALVSRAFATKLWPGESPIGAHVHIDDNQGDPRPVEIVGVVGDVKQMSLDVDTPLMLYVCSAQLHPDQVTQYGTSQFWLVRTRVDGAALASVVREAVHAVDPDAPAASLQTMEEYVSTSMAARRFDMRLLVAFAVVALVLAGMGLYGVLANSVSQRRRELGIRMALGAQGRDVLRLVLGEGLRLSATGVILGLVAAFVFTRVLSSMLFGVTATDPLTFGLIAVTQMAVALAACWLPARRATRVDPLTVMG